MQMCLPSCHLLIPDLLGGVSKVIWTIHDFIDVSPKCCGLEAIYFNSPGQFSPLCWGGGVRLARSRPAGSSCARRGRFHVPPSLALIRNNWYLSPHVNSQGEERRKALNICFLLQDHLQNVAETLQAK